MPNGQSGDMYTSRTMKLICILFTCLISATILADQKDPSTSDIQKRIGQLITNQKKAKSVYKKAPQDTTKKKKYIGATLTLADAYMTGPGLAPKVKYPQALRFYREVLKVDPRNKQAREAADLIISIYKSMNRPVPTG